MSDACFIVKSFTGKIDSSSFINLFSFFEPARTTRLMKVFNPLGCSSVCNRLMTIFNSLGLSRDFLIEFRGLDIIKKTVIEKCYH